MSTTRTLNSSMNNKNSKQTTFLFIDKHFQNILKKRQLTTTFQKIKL